jgi:hypothetical protein
VLIIAGVYTVRAAIAVTNTKGYENDQTLQLAHSDLTWASVVAWISVGLVVAVIVFAFAGGVALFGSGVGEEAMLLQGGGGVERGFSPFLIFLVIVSAILALTVGTLSARAATRIRSSSTYDSSTGSPAYQAAVIAAVLGIGSFSLFVIALIAYAAIRHHQKVKAMQALQEKRQQLQTELQELIKLQRLKKVNRVQP